jgi:hypothetical protein
MHTPFAHTMLKFNDYPLVALTISGKVSPYQERITHQKSKKPLR